MTLYLGIEGGGTRTSAGLYDEAGALLCAAEGGPSNPTAYGEAACTAVLLDLARRLLPADAGDVRIGAGLAGSGGPEQRVRIGRALLRLSGVTRVVIASDAHSVMHANAGTGAALLVIAGTGSSVIAQHADGRRARIGGYGPLFSDEGSAHAIAVAGLRAAAHAHDGMGMETVLTRRLLEAAGLNSFDDVAGWAAAASKHEVARLAPVISDAAEREGDLAARACIEDQARKLAAQVLAAQDKLGLTSLTPLYTHGGLFEHCALFRTAFEKALDAYSGLRPSLPEKRGHLAALALARMDAIPDWATLVSPLPEEALPATEQAAAADRLLDALSALEIVDAMAAADAALPAAVARQRDAIARAVDLAAAAIRADRRVFYIGAGTSGRLGVLDASECPPTFGVAPGRFTAIIAGGERALRHSIEGAEDDRARAVADLTAHGPQKGDLVVGIAASGSTPYTLAALEEARRRGVVTVLLCCNSSAPPVADVTIALDTGPEVLPGSTRLKAGTATKLVLNMISTGALALAGYVYAGRMVGVCPVNQKLVERARRILRELAHLDADAAVNLLDASGNDVRTAMLMALRELDRAQAEARLAESGGRLRDALEIRHD